MLKENSIYRMRVTGCDPITFFGRKLAHKDEGVQCGWMSFFFGRLCVDEYVYLKMRSDGEVDLNSSFVDIVEKLPSKDHVALGKINELDEITLTSPLLLEHYMNDYYHDQRVAEADDLRKKLDGECEVDNLDKDWKDTAIRALAYLDGQCISEALQNLYKEVYK